MGKRREVGPHRRPRIEEDAASRGAGAVDGPRHHIARGEVALGGAGHEAGAGLVHQNGTRPPQRLGGKRQGVWAGGYGGGV